MNRLFSRLVLLSALLFASGCGGGPQFAEAEGTVTKGGAPLKNVRVEFWPQTDGPKSTGVTDEQGHYTLKSEDGRTVGAVVGAHTIVLKDLNLYGDKFLGRKAENMPTLNPGAKERFAKTYSDAAKTDLKKTVTAGEKNVINIEVK
ncbi:Putative secreted protein OS=Rhodopirellula sp. SWK7 GN=RRSWK_05138 PE=4 SV=1 [Gemmata massiliana]|uniref:Carboxypeptidase regulatory-like domain-containing protein n=1 Tax=Gemmata massiliana TaxID=1210884 RepID=A0A6P2DLG7_9BACT|nr:hypothetical protein [Gemmata massiliana]VTS02577.1 Putative secreted protein OS=Rhodopirellula sp. SWK7 GN=RRSWK_05138 PE=4 SV=1 [Gemmata massiliana]